MQREPLGTTLERAGPLRVARGTPSSEVRRAGGLDIAVQSQFFIRMLRGSRLTNDPLPRSPQEGLCPQATFVVCESRFHMYTAPGRLRWNPMMWSFSTARFAETGCNCISTMAKRSVAAWPSDSTIRIPATGCGSRRITSVGVSARSGARRPPYAKFASSCGKVVPKQQVNRVTSDRERKRVDAAEAMRI